MKRLLIFIGLVLLPGCTGFSNYMACRVLDDCPEHVYEARRQRDRVQTGNGNPYIQTPNAYGPGIHSDQYGRPATLQPMYQGGSANGSYIQTPNAYGPGVHMGDLSSLFQNIDQ